MTDVVVNQGFFGILNRTLDRLQLLSKLMAWPTYLNHLDNHAKVAIGTLETFDNGGMLMRHSFFDPGGGLGVILPRGIDSRSAAWLRCNSLNHRPYRGDTKKCLTHLDDGITCRKSSRKS
jgi:hypothetical protein